MLLINYYYSDYYCYYSSRSSRPIWIISYNCDGDESRLSSCSRPQFPIGYVSSVCTHSTDAGVMCGECIPDMIVSVQSVHMVVP